jgi:poly-gamma-glutamate synthesis protein (capsule biosynthesis protein)
LHGVEIYQGKPIFYSVSNFVFQFGLQIGVSDDVMTNEKAMSELENPASNEAVLTTSHFDGGKLQEVRLYPADLGGARRPISQMGIPLTPSPNEAQRILKDLQEYSKPFGTNISIEENVGVIRLGPDGHSIAKGR